MNTILSLCASTCTAAQVNRVVKDGKLDFEVILFGSLSGGVIIGPSSAIAKPFEAVLLGTIAGAVSALYHWKLTDPKY